MPYYSVRISTPETAKALFIPLHEKREMKLTPDGDKTLRVVVDVKAGLYRFERTCPPSTQVVALEEGPLPPKGENIGLFARSLKYGLDQGVVYDFTITNHLKNYAIHR